MALGIFGEDLFIQTILPFALMFVLIFAILQRTKILGTSKQIDSIVSFIFAVIFVAVSPAVGVTIKIIPIIAVAIVILLVFMLMWGFIGGNVPVMNNGLKITAGIMMFITLVISVLWATDTLSVVLSVFKLSWGDKIVSSLMLFIFIAIIFAVVLTSKTEGTGAGTAHQASH